MTGNNKKYVRKNSPKTITSGSRAVKHLKQITVQDVWETPAKDYNKICGMFDIRPQLDVCADRNNRKCLKFFTEEDDALSDECQWDVPYYMNPPYSKVKHFIKKAYEMSQKYGVDGLCLTYSKTDTKWFHEYVWGKADIYFQKGRIRFILPNGDVSKHPAPYPSMWIIYKGKK